MKKKLLIPGSVLLGSILIFGSIFINSSHLSGYLSKTKPVSANILVVEGWIPDYAIYAAVEEAKKSSYRAIITTGIRSADLEYLTVGMNGYLIFYPRFDVQTNDKAEEHTFKVLAKSKMGGKYCAHFTVSVNDSLIAECQADNEAREYGGQWFGSLSKVDSVMIHFDNDMLDENGDVNLYVKELIIDDSIVIPYEFHSDYDIGYLDGRERIVNNFSTVAELARNKMIRYGIDSLKVFAFPSHKRGFNRTFSSVNACKRGLKTLSFEVMGINIITLGIHARRTLFTYRNLLDRSYHIGIIAVPEKTIDKDERPGKRKEIKEFLNLIYYSILLVPYYFI